MAAADKSGVTYVGTWVLDATCEKVETTLPVTSQPPGTTGAKPEPSSAVGGLVVPIGGASNGTTSLPTFGQPQSDSPYQQLDPKTLEPKTQTTPAPAPVGAETVTTTSTAVKTSTVAPTGVAVKTLSLTATTAYTAPPVVPATTPVKPSYTAPLTEVKPSYTATVAPTGPVETANTLALPVVKATTTTLPAKAAPSAAPTSCPVGQKLVVLSGKPTCIAAFGVK
jgi:hypothetical protein